MKLELWPASSVVSAIATAQIDATEACIITLKFMATDGI